MNSTGSPARPRVALIGVSGYGRIYVQLVREALARDEIQLTAAVVINPVEEAAVVAEFRSHGTRIYGTWEAMLAAEGGKLDLCLIPTGIQWHARMTIAALRAGACVLVEKPLAGSLADGEAIRAAEAQTGRWVAVGFQDIYCPASIGLKQRLCSGEIGRLQSVRMIGCWPRPRSYFSRNHWAGRYRADDAAVNDSPLNNAFAHFVNLGLFLAGATLRESADATLVNGELFRTNTIETFDTAVVRAQSTAGVAFWFGVTHCCARVREPEIYLKGDAGCIEWRHEQSYFVNRPGKEAEVVSLPDTTMTRQAMFAATLAKWRDASHPVCDTAMALKHTALLDALMRQASIRQVPDSLVHWTTAPDPAASVPVVAGLEEAMDRALKVGGQLSASGFTF